MDYTKFISTIIDGALNFLGVILLSIVIGYILFLINNWKHKRDLNTEQKSERAIIMFPNWMFKQRWNNLILRIIENAIKIVARQMLCFIYLTKLYIIGLNNKINKLLNFD